MTIEPNTLFHRHPPRVPDDELALDMQDYIQSELARAGLRHYEVSAYAPQHECQHNTNYWQFGDYIGIGAGAHGKISQHDPDCAYGTVQASAALLGCGGARQCGGNRANAHAPNCRLNTCSMRCVCAMERPGADADGQWFESVVDLEPALSQAQVKGDGERGCRASCVTDLGWRFFERCSDAVFE